MKKRTSRVSRRIVSLLMSLVLTLTLVTPAAFATEVVGGSGTAIIEGDTNPADPAPGEDSENNENKNTEDGKDEQPTEPGDGDKNPDEDNGDDASKPDGDSKDKENPDGDKKDEENKNEQPTEDENNGDDEIALLNAENAADVWVGNIAEKFAGGTGTESDPYQISNGAELAYLAQQVNSEKIDSEDTFITLTNNIDLNNKAWTPIGNSDSVFAGTFDGNGHTISGLYINITGSYSPKKGRLYKGLFGCVEDGTVQNLIVTGSVTIGNEKSVNVSYIGGIVGINDGGKVQNCGFYGTVSAKQNVSKTPKDCTKDNGGVVGKGKAAKCWYFCTDIKSASPLGACGGSAANCYQNVSEDVAKGDYIKDLNSFKAVLQMNAAGSDMWKPGEKHPEFLQESEKLVVLQPLFDDTTAAVQVNGSKEGAVVTGDESVVLTGTDVYYRVGENGNWTKISNEPLVLGANKVATMPVQRNSRA